MGGWRTGDQTGVRAGVLFSRDDDLTDDGRTVMLGGRRSHVSPKGDGEGSCTVRVQYRRYVDSVAGTTIDEVTVNVYTAWPTERLCRTIEESRDGGGEEAAYAVATTT